jgi:Zn-dependent peptidase ImmA (M78 family)
MRAIRSSNWAVNPVMAARQVLTKYWNGMLPVDPVGIARAEHVQVVEVGGYGVPWEYSGYYVKDDPVYGGPVIRVNAGDVLVRQRFTVAHEFGHCILGHENAPRDDPAKYNLAVRDPIERAANQFAAELLMPADALRKTVESGRMTHLEELARAFQVSSLAMDYRLSNLGLKR